MNKKIFHNLHLEPPLCLINPTQPSFKEILDPQFSSLSLRTCMSRSQSQVNDFLFFYTGGIRGCFGGTGRNSQHFLRLDMLQSLLPVLAKLSVQVDDLALRNVYSGILGVRVFFGGLHPHLVPDPHPEDPGNQLRVLSEAVRHVHQLLAGPHL